jgi:hypothetical protein
MTPISQPPSPADSAEHFFARTARREISVYAGSGSPLAFEHTKVVIGRSVVGWFAGSCTRRDLRGIGGGVNIVGVACELAS